MTTDPARFFAKAPTGKEIPILALRPGELPAWLKQASANEKAFIQAQGFKAGEKELLAVPGPDGKPARVLAGLGKGGNTADALAGAAQRLPEGGYRLENRLGKNEASRAALSWALGQYAFSRYRKRAEGKPRRLALPKGADRKKVLALAGAVTLARDLINTPAADMGPDDLAAAARRIAKEFGAKIRVITGDALLKANFPAIHAVGRAADKAPRLIDITWGNPRHPKLTLVGKGVCFDTGGLNIKAEAGMRWMKKDMGGGAVAFSLARAVMETGLKVRLRVLVPAVENAISGNAYRPGDVVKTRKGLSVEIGNTDAEGRVILSDALALGDEEAPELMIDFATLTGAARVALGPDLGALYATSEDLADGLAEAGREAGDPLWPMPLWPSYQEMLKSQVADLCNVSASPQAGSITAALFLQHSVEKAKAWAHLDIFCWNESAANGKPKGGEATGLLAAFAYLEKRFGA